MSIPLFKVHMPESVLEPVNKVLMSGYVSEGEESHAFEKNFQEWLGNPYVSLVNSGTSALILALRICGVKAGDEVISTPMTCLATNEPIMLAGAKIVWADIDPKTGNIDPNDIKKKITKKTKAIMVVHWAGLSANMDEIWDVASKNNLKVIEDAAHALGSLYNGKKIGSSDICSDAVCFSFQAIKNLSTVDGGAIAVKNKDDYERLKLLRWYGCRRDHSASPIKWLGDVYEPGYKMHMNNLNAVIGLEQLKYVDDIISKHKKNAEYILEALKDVEEIELMTPYENNEPSWWIFTILLPDEEYRKKLSNLLTQAEIGNGIVHNRNDTYALFSSFKTKLPNLDNFASRMLNIPCGWWLEQEDLDKMITTIKNSVEKLKAES